jgi:hypothetical protein
LCVDCKGGWSSKDRGKREPEPVPSYFEVHTTFDMKPLLYAQNIGEHDDEQDILNLASVLFHLRCNVSTKQLTVTDFFVKMIWTQVF